LSNGISGFFKWAVDAEYVLINPCVGVKPPKFKNKDGFEVWAGEDVEKYQKCWPIGTKERVWLEKNHLATVSVRRVMRLASKIGSWGS